MRLTISPFIRFIWAASILTILCWCGPIAAQLVAQDDAESYSSFNYGDNGGTGFGPATYLEGTGGGVFLSKTVDRGIDGANSFGLFAGKAENGNNGQQAYSRAITNPVTRAEFTLSARFDLSNSVGPSGINLKAAQGSTFGASEKLFFGLTRDSGNNVIFVSGSTNQTIDLGSSIPGSIIDFRVVYDTGAGTYTVGAKFRGNPNYTTASGNLKSVAGLISYIGFGNFNSGGDQNLITDNLVIAVPEPGIGAAGIVAMTALCKSRRGRNGTRR